MHGFHAILTKSRNYGSDAEQIINGSTIKPHIKHRTIGNTDESENASIIPHQFVDVGLYIHCSKSHFQQILYTSYHIN